MGTMVVLVLKGTLYGMARLGRNSQGWQPNQQYRVVYTTFATRNHWSDKYENA
jgi:hypothetical protein